jgi:hypothetical protein
LQQAWPRKSQTTGTTVGETVRRPYRSPRRDRNVRGESSKQNIGKTLRNDLKFSVISRAVRRNTAFCNAIGTKEGCGASTPRRVVKETVEIDRIFHKRPFHMRHISFLPTNE